MHAITASIALLAATAATATAQQTVYAIGNGGSSLVRFLSNDPGNVTVVADFAGDGVFLDALDFRPATGELYGYLDSSDSYFTVNLSSAQLTRASNVNVGATTNTFSLGMDFNPTIDRLRVVTESAQNIVYNPNTGTAAAFTTLFYADGDVNAGQSPLIIDNGYTQSFIGSTSTAQYGIDHGLNALVTIANNSGVLTTVGPLGVDTDIYSGFDIFTNPNGTDTAYSILTGLDGVGRFYTIDLGTGSATLVGNLGFSNQVYSLAVIPAPGAVAILGLSLIPCVSRRRR